MQPFVRLKLPSHVHEPSPAWVAELEGKRVFLDVGVLLRGALFPRSYSRKLLEHIERTQRGKAVISPHVRNEALRVLGIKSPASIPRFVRELLRLQQARVLEVVPDGKAAALKDWRSLGEDDDTVMASAFESSCDMLSTLDESLGKQAANRIRVLEPAELRFSRMTMFMEGEPLPKIFYGPDRGTLVLQAMPSEGTTDFVVKGGRRYVFATESGFACWLSEENWSYEFGYVDSFGCVARLPVTAHDKRVRIGLSLDLNNRQCSIAVAVEGSAGDASQNRPGEYAPWCEANSQTEVASIKKQSLPRTVGKQWQFFGSPKGDQYNGHWQGVLSSAQPHGLRSFRHAVQHGAFFSPLDHMRHPIEDAIFAEASLIVPEQRLIA